MSPLKLLRRNEKGAAAIEMAIALPVLLVMIYGIFQVGLIFQANAGMQHALGEGARYATLCVPTSGGCSSSALVLKNRAITKAAVTAGSTVRMSISRNNPCSARFIHAITPKMANGRINR